MDIDIRIAKFVNSMICHDVMNKLSNVSMVIEGLDGSSSKEDAIKVIAREGAYAIDQMRFFRVALGSGTGEKGLTGEAGVKEAKKIAKDMLAINNVDLLWDEDNELIFAKQASRSAVKLLLNVILCANLCVFKDGNIYVQFKNINETDIGILVTAEGPVCRLRTDFVNALHMQGNIDDLNPKTAVAWFTAILAQEIGADIDALENGKYVRFALALTKN